MAGYYGNYNPYVSVPYTQNRLNQLEQQYGMQQQQQYMNQQQQVPYGMNQQPQIIKGRPVSSYDEAKASMIDLDGSLFVFPDIGNKMIYTKQIMLDGTSEFNVYAKVEQNGNNNQSFVPVQEKQTQEYVSKQEFEDMKKSFETKLKNLMEELGYDGKNDAADNK